MKPKERTSNKICLCWGCWAPLTGDKMMFCNETCAAAYGQRQSARDLGKDKLWVYLNKSMLDLTVGENIGPHEFSAFIHTGHDMTCVALYDKEDIESIPDAEANTYDGYWRPIVSGGINLEPHNPQQMREEGILSYLCDHFGLRTETKIALAIHELVNIESAHDPIELFNTL